jgi:hypothetical protein
MRRLVPLLLTLFALAPHADAAPARKPGVVRVARAKARTRAAGVSAVRRAFPKDYPIAFDLAVAAPVPRCGAGFGKTGTTLPDDPELYRKVDAKRTHGSAQLVEMVRLAVARVRGRWPAAAVPWIGRLDQTSRQRAAWLMHQDGLDADIALWSAGGRQLGFGQGLTPATLDPGPTWELVRAFLATGRAEWILLDQSLIDVLARHARAVEGWSEAQTAMVFPPAGTPRIWERRGFVRHVPRHDNHIHVHATCDGVTPR